jgi:release factor glutamine methyltransferase
MRLVTLPGVFRPISDSWLLARTLAEQGLGPSTSVLDLCTGSGAIAVAAARAGAGRVVAADLSRRAVATAKINAIINGVGDRVQAARTDLYASLPPGERFDYIVSNPPYVPDPSGDALPQRGPERAWDAGRDGRVLLDPLIAGAPARLKPGGALLVVHTEINGIDATLEAMRAAGLESPVVLERHHGPLGPLMRERRDHLVATGRWDAEREEELVVVIAGRAPARFTPSSPPPAHGLHRRPSTPRRTTPRPAASSSAAATPPAHRDRA